MEQPDLDIALLAHQSQIGLNHIYQTRMPPRIDPRQFMYPNQGYPQQNYPQQGYPQHNQPQQSYGGNDEYGVPGAVPVQQVQLPMIMRQPDGTIVDLSTTPSVAQTYGPVNNGGMNNIQGFSIPDYSKYNQPTVSEDTESTLDIILREIKSLKKAINKLIRETDKSKLSVVTPTPTEKNINDSDS